MNGRFILSLSSNLGLPLWNSTDVPYGRQAPSLWLTIFYSFLTRGLAGTFNFPSSQITSRQAAQWCAHSVRVPSCERHLGSKTGASLWTIITHSLRRPSPRLICSLGRLFIAEGTAFIRKIVFSSSILIEKDKFSHISLNLLTVPTVENYINFFNLQPYKIIENWTLHMPGTVLKILQTSYLI